MGLFSHGKSNNKGFWNTMAVNAFNQGNDQQALQFATLGYEGSVQNIQMAINNRNFKKQQEQMKQQQEELQQKTNEATALTEQSTNQNQKQNVQGVRRNAKETNSQKDSNLTQGTQNSTGTWLKKALGGDNTNNSEEWY